MDTCISIPLKYCTYEIWPESRSVRTVFPDGLSCGGMRDENDPVNIQEAEEEGYTGKDSVWRSLVEHELLHSIICEVLFNRPSNVLRSEAGDVTFYSARQKYEEEVLVLSFQEWLNEGCRNFPDLLSQLSMRVLIKNRLGRLLSGVEF